MFIPASPILLAASRIVAPAGPVPEAQLMRTALMLRLVATELAGTKYRAQAGTGGTNRSV